MKAKTEKFVSQFKNPVVKINHLIKTQKSQKDEDHVSDSKMMNKEWSMKSLMAELPLSSSPFPINCESPTLPCDSCRPSTVFYSPRYQDINNSSSFSHPKKQFPNLMNISSSYDSASNIGFNGRVESNGLDKSTGRYDYESSIGVTDDYSHVLYSVPPTIAEEDSQMRGTQSATSKFDEFGEAIPVIGVEGNEHRSNHRPKAYQEFLDEVQNHKQRAEFDALRKTTYTHLLRKLTEKEEAIDEWESSRRRKAEFQLDKLERKLEKKQAEAVHKVHKKLAEAKMEAQKKKAKARQSALKEMAKHCSQLN